MPYLPTRDVAAKSDLARALREALYAGVIAFGLFVLFIGLKTDQNIRNELVLVQRWGLLAIVVAPGHGRALRLCRLRQPYGHRRSPTSRRPRRQVASRQSPISDQPRLESLSMDEHWSADRARSGCADPLLRAIVHANFTKSASALLYPILVSGAVADAWSCRPPGLAEMGR